MKSRVFLLLLIIIILFMLSVSCKDRGENETLWSFKSSDKMTWEQAHSYCAQLREKGVVNWRLPTVSELRVLVANCERTEQEGSCKVSDDCSNDSCWSGECMGCTIAIDGRYSIFKDTGEFWSATSNQSNEKFAWYIGFYDGLILDTGKNNESFVRCVRAELKQ